MLQGPVLLELQQDGSLEHERPVIPPRSEIVFAHAHPGVDTDASKGISFTDIPERNLAMITHHVVGIAEDARDESAAPERRVHAIRDVHVDLDPVAEPRVAVFSCLCL